MGLRLAKKGPLYNPVKWGDLVEMKRSGATSETINAKTCGGHSPTQIHCQLAWEGRTAR